MNARKVFCSQNIRALKVYGLGPEFTFSEFEEWFSKHYGKPCPCGAKAISIDHVLPLARGGRHAIGNFQFLCRSCNSRKCAWLTGEKRVYPWDKPDWVRYVGPYKRRAKKAVPAKPSEAPIWRSLDGSSLYVLLSDGRVYYRHELEKVCV